MVNNLSLDSSCRQLQTYFKSVLELRGFNNQSAQDKMLLLIEEVGELAKAIRKEEAVLAIDKKKIENYSTIESEIADVGIVLISLCNILNIDLISAIIKKEKDNSKRKWS